VEIVGLWRYPVKSMQGEPRELVEVGPSGIAGDRRCGVQVAGSGRILSAKREGRLLLAEARTKDTVAIWLPSGESLSGMGSATDAALSGWLERPVKLVEADPVTTPTFESQAVEADDESASITWQGRPGGFVDSSPVHLLTTASLRAVRQQRPDLDWQVRRFRPNLLIDVPGDERVEDEWIGHRCLVGPVELEIFKACGRCVMTTRSQPGGLERQLGVLRHLSDVADGNFGVLGRVLRPGPISLHDPVTVDA
jgi:uncharacterized protein YcbX